MRRKGADGDDNDMLHGGMRNCCTLALAVMAAGILSGVTRQHSASGGEACAETQRITGVGIPGQVVEIAQTDDCVAPAAVIPLMSSSTEFGGDSNRITLWQNGGETSQVLAAYTNDMTVHNVRFVFQDKIGASDNPIEWVGRDSQPAVPPTVWSYDENDSVIILVGDEPGRSKPASRPGVSDVGAYVGVDYAVICTSATTIDATANQILEERGTNHIVNMRAPDKCTTASVNYPYSCLLGLSHQKTADGAFIQLLVETEIYECPADKTTLLDLSTENVWKFRFVESNASLPERTASFTCGGMDCGFSDICGSHFCLLAYVP